MNDIITKENLPENIDKLAAQRHLYSQAKVYSIIILIICVLVPVLMSFAKLLFPALTIISQIAIVYSVFAVFVKIGLADCQNSCRIMAAGIQQLFDCGLFNLEWNEALCGNKPQPEDIFRAQRGVDRSKLSNWYEEVVSSLEHNVAVLICQRTNVTYDQGIRRYFKTCVNIMFFVALAIVFLIGLSSGKDVWTWFLYAIVPLMPIVSWYLDVRKQNEDNLTALNKLQSLIEKCLSGLDSNTPVRKEDLMTIQNFMYLHRKSSYTIPDFIYKIKRSKSEQAAYYTANQLCARYKL